MNKYKKICTIKELFNDYFYIEFCKNKSLKIVDKNDEETPLFYIDHIGKYRDGIMICGSNEDGHFDSFAEKDCDEEWLNYFMVTDDEDYVKILEIVKEFNDNLFSPLKMAEEIHNLRKMLNVLY